MDLQNGALPYPETRPQGLLHAHMHEEDNTFAPPALSAYGLALLGTLIRGQEEMKSLKSKLSVHFQESPKSLNSSPASKAVLPEGSSSTVGNTSNVTATSNVSDSSMNTNPNANSYSNTNANTSEPNSIPNSNANLSSHPSPRSGFSDQVEHRDLRKKEFETPSSAGDGSVPLAISHHVKRSRLSRRFKSLGPPKRASDVELEKKLFENVDDSHENDHSEHEAALVHDYRHLRLDHRSVSDSVVSPKRVSSNSEFFKSLERLKNKSPGFESVRSPASSVVGHRENPRIASVPTRVPLHEYSPQYLNEKNNDFRKPRNPKSPIPVDSKPPTSATITPVPSSVITTRKRQHDQQAFDDSTRRKIMYVNSHQYEKLELLGRGGSSKVYKVRSFSDKKVYAIKKVSFDQFDEACVRGFKGEIDLLNKLRDDNRVVSLMDHAVSEGSIYLVMECGDLDLAHVLSNKLASGKSLDMNFVRFHATEILRCVQAVHKAGIVHSDLKPANFLFVRGTLKIIDFGIANAVPDHTANIYRQSQIGTPNYMAPEALIEASGGASMNKSPTFWKVGQPSDIWSCGCIIYQMIYGRPPYGSFSGQQRIMAIMNPMVEIQFSSKGIDGNRVPQSLVILMRKCLERNPNNRWTVEQCLDSDFLKPKAVSKAFVKDLVYSAVNFGYSSKDSGNLTDEIYDKLVDTVLKQIEDLNFA